MLAAIDLDAARDRHPAARRESGIASAARHAEPDSVRGAVTLAVHPGRAEPAIGGPGAMHLTALHLEELRSP
jgi:hypothetical protein